MIIVDIILCRWSIHEQTGKPKKSPLSRHVISRFITVLVCIGLDFKAHMCVSLSVKDIHYKHKTLLKLI